MTELEAVLTRAFDYFQRGAIDAADTLVAPLLDRHGADPRVAVMAGQIASRLGRAEDAAVHLRVALAAAPDNVDLRVKLCFALLASDAIDEAYRVAAGSQALALLRVRAFVQQRRGRIDEAITGYRDVLRQLPADYESWNNLGLLLTDRGDIEGAIAAFRSAIAARPDDPSFHVGLSKAFAIGERHPERLAMLREAIARRFPREPRLLVELGFAHSALAEQDAAERAYRDAIALDARHAAAYVELGLMLESLNRLDDMDRLVREGRERGVDAVAIGFVEAWLLKRRGRFAEALPLAEAAGDGVNPARRAQLIGDLADRLGDADRAMAAFAEMNALAAAGPASDYARALDFPGSIAAMIDGLSQRAVDGHLPARPDGGAPSPVFLVGFPRSGTTLLDTLLMNLPELDVLEELTMIEQLEEGIGGAAQVAGLSGDQVTTLRDEYFDRLEALRGSPAGGGTIVDKFPLNLVRAPLIHRLFPDARFIMVERHPCDVVLSCFMARFQTNRAMVHFLDIESAARLYDLAMQAWTRSLERLPLDVHHVRYERMIDDLETEMRALCDFLGLAWRPEILDNMGSAARRAHIATMSYAQVAEPLYARAAGRWQRYRRHLEPVFPILAPWAERMGYAMD